MRDNMNLNIINGILGSILSGLTWGFLGFILFFVGYAGSGILFTLLSKD